MSKALAFVKESIALQVLLLLAFALLLNQEGPRVPSGNEYTYLLYPFKAFHPQFLATDWTFQEPTAGHPVFNWTAGWLTLMVSIEAMGWIGRVACCTLMLIALLLVGRQFRLPTWIVSLAILIWLVERQAFVAVEWIIGSFEAKTISYICLFFAMNAILNKRLVPPAILTGLAFSFHSEVGLWGGAAVGLAYATTHPVRDTLKFAGIATVFSLPGVITALPLALAQRHLTVDDAKYMVTVQLPFHLDPKAYGMSKIGLVMLMLLFNVLHAHANPSDGKLKFLVRFQLFAAMFFAIAMALRAIGGYSLLIAFPARVFAVVILLFFLWHLAAAWVHRRETKSSTVMIAIAVLVLLGIPSPLMKLQRMASEQLPRWKQPPDDFTLAARWIQHNTPETTLVIAPPWRREAFYEIRRPLIAAWNSPRFDQSPAWRERIESLTGDLSNLSSDDNLTGEMNQQARDHYANLSESDLRALNSKYNDDREAIVMTTSTYNLPELHRAGQYVVYRLTQ